MSSPAEALIHARKEGEAAYSFLEDVERALESPLEKTRFWETVLNKIAKEKGSNEPQSYMDDKEAREFEKRTLDFGKYRGRRIEEVPLTYLDWLVGQSETFMATTRRYLLNPKVATMLEQALEKERNERSYDGE